MHCGGSDAHSHVNRPTNQQQRNNNNYDDDEVADWNEVVACVDEGFCGVGFGGNHTRHGLSENGKRRSDFNVRGFECFEPIADTSTKATTQRKRRHDGDDDDNASATSHAQRHGRDDLDRRTGKTSPYGVPHEALELKTESKENQQANRQRPLDVPFPVATRDSIRHPTARDVRSLLAAPGSLYQALVKTFFFNLTLENFQIGPQSVPWGAWLASVVPTLTL